MLQILTEQMNKYYESNAKLNDAMRMKKARLEDCKREKRGLLEVVKALGTADEEIVAEIKMCNEETKKLESEIALLNQQMQTPAVTVADVRGQLQNLHEIMRNPNILSSLKLEVIQTFIDKIELDGDSFEVFYKNLPIVK